MPVNYPFPYQLHYLVTTPVGTHKHRVGINVTSAPAIGTPFEDVLVTPRSGIDLDLEAYCALYFTYYLGILGANYAIGNIELWSYPEESYDGTYVGSYDGAFDRSTGYSALIAQYRVYTFRTNQGGVAKVNVFDKSDAGNAQLLYPALSEDEQDFIDHMISDDCAIIGLDGGFPIGFIRASSGQNEALWRRSYR